MKVLLHEFWTSWHTWVFIVSMAVVCGAMTWLVIWTQRADYQRRLETTLDAASARSLRQIEDQIARLREADQKSAAAIQQNKQEVKAIKEEIKTKEVNR